MLNLPALTLIMVETQAHDLARIALVDAFSKATFGGGAVVHTDRPDAFDGLPPEVRIIQVPLWPSKVASEEFYYSEAAQAATTSHALMYQWDAGIRDVGMWTDDFLAYDYIGAPWPGARGHQWQPRAGQSVGNGGFTLISKKLGDFLYQKRHEFRADSDVAVACRWRPEIEAQIGAKWAPEDVAFRFSFEHGNDAERAAPSFGYHDVFNWPLAIDREDILRRTRLMMLNPYVRRTTKLRVLGDQNPWLMAAIGQNEFNDACQAPQRFRPGTPSATIARAAMEREMQRRGLKA